MNGHIRFNLLLFAALLWHYNSGLGASNVIMFKRISVFISVAVLIAACHTLPVQNKPLKSYSPDYGYRYRNIAPEKDDSDSLLMVLTFSGGGTRAAALSYGVLCALRDTPIYWEGRSRRLLDEVDVISSASGGSLTAAYYGLFGDRIFTDYPDRVLYHDIQGNIIRRLLSPKSMVKLLSPFYGRTDLVADQFSRRIFEEKTYSDLVARNARPYIIINTTDMARGSRLGFTQGLFDLFYSDLSCYPIGNAVAASAAYPGLLAPMTIRNYPKPADFTPPDWVTADHHGQTCFVPDDPSCYLDKSRPYIHVVDGGVADNLGLLPVIMGLDGRYSDDKIAADKPEKLPKKVIIITVNAEGSTKTTWDLDAGLPGLFDTLFAAGTTPLGNFYRAQISYLRQQIAHRNNLREIKQALGQQGMTLHIPALERPDVDFHFIEVAFDQLPCMDEREQVCHVPTNFHLPKKSVDKVCESAKAILAVNPDFQTLLATLQPPK
jgi:NTE family protein